MVESVEDVQHEKLTTEELLDAWPVLDSEERLEGFHLLPRDEAADFFLELSTGGQASIVKGMPARERRDWRVGFDPAGASAPFVATLVDVFGLVIYFSVARVILAGRLP